MDSSSCATLFGLGNLNKRMPGTIGSIAALPLIFIIEFLYTTEQTHLIFILAIILFMVGVEASNAYVTKHDRCDPKEVIIDEFVGQYLCLSLSIFVTPIDLNYLALMVVGNFIFFRIFDIFKPWPIKYLETIKGGLGIMIDDIAAALYAFTVYYFLSDLII